MSVGETGERLVFIGKFGKIFKHLCGFFLNDPGCLTENYHIGIVADIAACSAEVYYRLGMGALHSVGVNVRHNIVAHLFLTFFGNIVVYIVLMRFKLFDLLVGNIKTQLFFSFGEGYPETAPCSELEVFGKNMLHFLARVTRGER